MKSIFSTQIVRYNELSENQKADFSDSLYELTCKIFGGGNKEEFEEMISKCNADDSKYLLYKNEKNEWVGYIGLHRFRKKIDGKQVAVFRSQIGLISDYRRTNASFTFAIKEILKYKLSHLSEEVFAFVAIINPSMYCITEKYAPRVYPSPFYITSEHAKNIIKQCSEYFGFPEKEGDTFWARSVGWYPLNTQEELDFWKNSKDKRVRFYQELNPDFLKGKGLITLIPLTFLGTLQSFVLFIWYAFKKKLKFLFKRKN